MSNRALCLLCGTDLKDGKPVIVDALRKLVEELKDVQDVYPGLHNVIAKIEKLIGGE